MLEAFVSVVVSVDANDSQDLVAEFLQTCSAHLSASFSDHEIVIVDNVSGLRVSDLTLQGEAGRHCYVVGLARSTPWDVAVFAGLERANGDYVVIFDVLLQKDVDLITEMYLVAQEGFDFVVLHEERRGWLPTRRRAFFWLLSRAATAPIDAGDRKELLVSRRALNWSLRHKARARYLHELYVTSGFAARKLFVRLGTSSSRRTDSDRRNIAWGALTRMTDYPLRLAQLGLSVLSLVLFLGVTNALTVRLAGRNLLGGQEASFPGWAYLVVLLSAGFLLTNVSIYAVLRTLRVLADDLRDEPLYVIEQVQRLE